MVIGAGYGAAMGPLPAEDRHKQDPRLKRTRENPKSVNLQRGSIKHSKHRNSDTSQHFLYLTGEQESLEFSTTMGGHHDQITTQLFSNPDNSSMRAATISALPAQNHMSATTNAGPDTDLSCHQITLSMSQY